MITLNIIPPELKKEIKIKKIYTALKDFYAVLFINICLIAIIYLTALGIIQAHFLKTINNTSLLIKSTKNYEQQIKEINTKIDEVEKIQSEAVNWSYLISSLFYSAPKGIFFNSVSANKEKNFIIINGVAAKRENLLAFNELLKKSKYFKNVNLPLSSLLKKENINFTITAEIKSYDFNQLQ
jgi:Tfp pilus assembly protein PilN